MKYTYIDPLERLPQIPDNINYYTITKNKYNEWNWSNIEQLKREKIVVQTTSSNIFTLKNIPTTIQIEVINTNVRVLLDNTDYIINGNNITINTQLLPNDVLLFTYTTREVLQG